METLDGDNTDGEGRLCRWVTIYAPALMTFPLFRVSGVGLLERTPVESKPGYRRHIEDVSAFFPRRPRRRGHTP